MKNFFRNLIIIASYLTSIPFWARIFAVKPLVRVWCLHDVKNSQAQSFEEKIVWLKQNYNLITPTQFKKGELSKAKTNLLITFDDGYVSWFDNVLPILKKYDLKAVFFIVQSFRCHESKLLADGHSLGGHSKTHARLTEISKEQLAEEINQSVKSEFFAYPFGDKNSYNAMIIEEIKKAGYNYGFTILPGFNNLKTNKYLLRRDSLDADTPMLIFKLWLKGSYDCWKKWF